MARIDGVQQADAGMKVKLVYGFMRKGMTKMTGRAPAGENSGIEPIEVRAHQPKLLSGMGKFQQAVRNAHRLDERAREPRRAEGRTDDRLRVPRRPRLADLPQLRPLRRRAAGAAALPRERPVHGAREAGARLHGRRDADTGRRQRPALRPAQGALQRRAAHRDHGTADGRKPRPFSAAFAIGSAGFSDGMVCVPPDRAAASPPLARSLDARHNSQPKQTDLELGCSRS
jgi:hypothetical protein